MAAKSDKAEDTYISGEEHRALSQTKSAQATQVTIQTRWLVWAGAVVVLLAVGFWSGMAYQKGHTKSITATTSSQPGGAGRFGGRGGQRSSGFGQVTAVSSTSITITNQRTNASSTYAITSSTTITDNGQATTTSDIQTGETVIIMTASGSTTTASRILVNPSFGGTSAPVSPDDSSTSQTN